MCYNWSNDHEEDGIMLDEKDKIIEQLQKTIAEQNAIIAELKAQLANALEKLNMNSNKRSPKHKD